MLTKTMIRKIMALTMLLILATNTFMPGVAYALTAGPTSPEATSFEPVDTTDMVNLNTGSFTYNLPLLEVPGPEGGYPLSLSYHAGIQPDLDASWVGLGWTLNPGAINRNVNGTPDDWNGVDATLRDYWSGGTRQLFTIGASVGISNTPTTVRAGLTIGTDTYQGFGVGSYVGVGYNNGFSNIGISAGISPWGGPYSSLGVTTTGSGSIGLNISTNFENTNVSGSANLGLISGQISTNGEYGYNVGPLGSSMSSQGSSSSFKLSGFGSSVSNSKQGKITTSTKGMAFDIPVGYFNVTLGYEKSRYWSDETENSKSYGSYINRTRPQSDYNNYTDVYDNFSAYDIGTNIYDEPEVKEIASSGFPDYDQYNVLGQGLSGSIRPYAFQHHLINQARILKSSGGFEWQLYFYRDNTNNQQPVFRFENDFSNSYRQSFGTSMSDLSNMHTDTYASFDSSPKYGDNDGNYGFAGGNKLAGSKSVQVGVFIKPSKIDTPSARPLLVTSREIRSSRPNAIPGFSITNSSGITYHYALPAYASQEESYQAKTSNKGNNFNRLSRPMAYAYMWHLTTITGPDYVDRNGNSIADAGDWGYYVNFEYGLWNENFIWRNPAEGFRQDEDPTFLGVSMGQKEIYYLNAIKTRTHTALFEKEERLDGRGASKLIKTLNANDQNKTYQHENGLFDNSSQPVMRLNKIYLLNNTDLGNLGINYGASGSGSLSYDGYVNSYDANSLKLEKISYTARRENVLDNNDVSNIRSAIESKSIRIIDFSYDYSLCKGTSNSFQTSYPPSKYGKLTLTSVKTRGKAGADILPLTKFGYNLEENEIKKSSYAYTINPGSFSGETKFEVGDLIETNDANPIFLGAIKAKAGSNYTLVNSSIVSPITSMIRTTKNPPYNRKLYDLWQMYKSNADVNQVEKNANRFRRIDDVSAKSTDVWSLRTVTGPYGDKLKIEYETNTYSTNLINESFPFIVTGMNLATAEWQNNNLLRANATIDISGYDHLSEVVDVGTTGKMMMVVNYTSGSIAGFEDVFSSDFVVNGFVSPNTLDVSFSNTLREGGTDIRRRSHWERTWSAFGKTPKQILENNNTIVPQFLTANVSFTRKAKPYEYGGGVRVKQLAISTPLVTNKTIYHYNFPGSSKSSGAITYSPTTLPTLSESFANNNTYSSARALYQQKMYALVSDLYTFSREIPAPGVFYEYVTVEDKIVHEAERNQPFKTTYQFEVPNDHTIFVQDKFVDVNTANTRKRKGITIKNFSSPIGNLLRTTQYDNNGKKLSEVVNNYLHSGLERLPNADFFTAYDNRLNAHKYQGYLHEIFFEFREQRKVDDDVVHERKFRQSYSSRESYPCIPVSTTNINYVNGTQTVTENLAFDFYSGAVTKTLSIDANGNRFIDSITPAYRQYPEMGLKSINDNNKNMLTQTAASYSYRVNQNNQPIGLLGAAINTWSKTANVLMPDYSGTQQDGAHSTGTVWRPDMTYTWAPEGSTQNGMTAIGVFVDFNWANQASPSAQNAGWVKTGQTTLYDVFSHALEASDMNEQYAATKMGYNHSKVMVSGGPAKYAEIAYSGAEDPLGSNNFFNGDINIGGTINTNPAYVHTGEKSVQVVNGNGFQYEVPVNKLDNTRDYWASVWVKSGNGIPASNESIFYTILGTYNLISGQISAPNPQGWQLATIKIPASSLTGGTLIVGCYNNSSNPVYFDDIRFHPLNAGINSYVYDNFTGELTYILDNNNFFTKFEYDAVGRLVKTYRETQPDGIRPVSEFNYHYKDMPYEHQAKWISTGYSRCVTNSQGVATGAEELQQQDDNVLSATYRQKRWVLKAGPSSLCVPGTNLTVYTRLSFVNYYQVGGKVYADIVVEFYNDAQYTIPVSVSNYPITINVTTNCNGPIPDGYEMICNGTSATAITGALIEDWYGLQNCTFEYVPPAYPGDPGGGWVEICTEDPCSYNYYIEASEVPAP